jgi:hypothetical protein
MSARRRRLVRTCVWLAALATVAVATGAGITGLRAEEGELPAGVTEEDVAQWELWKQLNPDPFEPPAPDPGAVTYDSMSAGERADLDEAALRSETSHGYAVHQAWSSYSHQAAANARVKAAEYAAGLAGVEDVGVY